MQSAVHLGCLPDFGCFCHDQDLATDLQDDRTRATKNFNPTGFPNRFVRDWDVKNRWNESKDIASICIYLHLYIYIYIYISTPLKSKTICKRWYRKLRLDFVSSSLSNVPTHWTTGLPWRTEAVADAAPVHLRGSGLGLWTMNHGSTYLRLFVGDPGILDIP